MAVDVLPVVTTMLECVPIFMCVALLRRVRQNLAILLNRRPLPLLQLRQLLTQFAALIVSALSDR